MKPACPLITRLLPAILLAACNAGTGSGGRDGPEGAELQLEIAASRTSGVAPLAVFFDATGTPGLDDGSYVDATFVWDFDVDDADPDGRHERASGFLAAHVFEAPGTYHVRVRATDARGRVGVADLTIEAKAFSGTTYYVAASGSDRNDGRSMENPVLTLAHAVSDLAGPDTRILFRKGDTFSTTYVRASRPGPVILASYEDPGRPSSQAPILYSTSVDGDWGTLDIGEDWRIMDLRVRSGGTTAGEWGESGGPRYPGGVGFAANNGLIYRVEQDNLHGGWMSPGGTYNTVADCDIHDVSSTAYVSDGDGGAVIGNWVHDMDGDDLEHVFRLQAGSRYFIAFNEFGPKAVVNYDAVTIRGNSDRVVIYHNVIHDWLTAIWPQVRNSYEEYEHHCVIDSNLFLGTEHRQRAIALHSKDIVIRNNVFLDYEGGIGVEDDTVVGPSQRIRIYNNTFINATAGGDFNAVSVDGACTDIDIRNNLMLDVAGSAPQHTSFISGTLHGTSNGNLFWGPGWSATSRLFPGGTLADWQRTTGQDGSSVVADPLIAVTDGTARTSGALARPAAQSPAVGGGVALPSVTLDFYGNPRDATPDRGAVEVGAGGPAIPWE